ncbi:hypothetical protein PLEOSDRAFT_154396 [Pleurotus ostreatus PC15]|uniref:Uncharacterized protein n=1 Tax=Pleurotus ostreatus (strain PC15) TaxID=1137138 RepID=A0A067P715_PLEO1|nr:hypothetical protein PLEOSDRAFT_154396 [Pleurotus ostreatus PC15]
MRFHLLVEVFQANGYPSAIKCCLHALSMFELQPSMTKRLSRIMSNVVHILGFLSVVSSPNALDAIFTEACFKMVFGAALQYLQTSRSKQDFANDFVGTQNDKTK